MDSEHSQSTSWVVVVIVLFFILFLGCLIGYSCYQSHLARFEIPNPSGRFVHMGREDIGARSSVTLIRDSKTGLCYAVYNGDSNAMLGEVPCE